MTTATTLAEGLHFGEGPRWHAGRLWFSDFYDHAVKSIDETGAIRTERIIDVSRRLGIESTVARMSAISVSTWTRH